MNCKKNKYGLTQQQENFLQEYIKTGNGYKSYLVAYPKSKKWARNSVDVAVVKLLKNAKISQRIDAHNQKIQSTLEKSETLNRHKLLETALNILENTKDNPQQYAHAINVLKLLYQQQGMMPKAENNTTVNIINNNSIDNISNFLDL